MKRMTVIAGPLLFIVGVVAGCDRPPLEEEEYVETWILATLRARGKGTEPLDELDKLLAGSSITREDFDEAQVEWFGKETNERIREGIRKILNTPGLPSRLEYVRSRVIVFLRSRILGTPFREELASFAAFHGYEASSFDAAARIWIGDPETDTEIDATYRRLEGSLRVDWGIWTVMSRHPLWPRRHAEDWLQEELDRRGISRKDWDAAEEVHEAWETETEPEDRSSADGEED